MFGFTGRPEDGYTGLRNHLHRWTDPRTADWMSEDPWGFTAGDTNTRRNCINSPTNLVDPSGLDDIWQGVHPDYRDGANGGILLTTVDGYSVKYRWAKGSRTIADNIADLVDNDISVPGPWGQPGDQASGNVDTKNGAPVITLVLQGHGVCNTIGGSFSTDAATIDVYAYLPEGNYSILWLWNVFGSTNDVVPQKVSVRNHAGNDVRPPVFVTKTNSPFADGHAEKSWRLIKTPGWKLIASLDPTYRLSSSPVIATPADSSKPKPKTSVTIEIKILQIKKLN